VFLPIIFSLISHQDMCYTSFQKYKGCRIFRQHHVYRDIQCEEMLMWSSLFKRKVWCRRVYEEGTAAFASSERFSGPPNYPAPKPGIEVPGPLLCHRCRSPRKRGKGKPYTSRYRGKRAPSRLTVSVRHLLSAHATRTCDLIARALPKAVVYNMIQTWTKGKWRS